ncbi:DEAD/DEAH box helicase [Vibrio parahaemolyticus]|uniref:DEAD/DEAH box helicase n=1 Tax=Vibrio parahaemolyticus TaxID=670 RepID=UPI0004254E23|nr:helicase-related protein [Vibrio parahaemolyticus]EKA7371505.1 DEAD/DEAH box helicase [Vibrio parahaemolyticus]ELA9375170.1 DEAD/DEAH box helicase [Vibrio parahaemolyticus]ELK8486127.1 DEAD/DEAH box helicase [Vibrio parahaemolyticus]EMA2436696.1 DEAD/DEAH box helicase [Vibrio parahaemolyticus]HCG6062615.1 DEAD/DEAH box helicase [Vibrio parahaemolyticus]
MTQAILEQLSGVLSGLKDFQKATVDLVIDKYQIPEHSHRILVADEVGLGKTIVAKGVIAQLLKRHVGSNTTKPMRVIYICSNLALADENRQKLALFNGEDAKRWVKPSTFGRLVELALKPKHSEIGDEHAIEVCTLTPSTSFTLTAGAGNCWERVILAVLLSQTTKLHDFVKPIRELFKTNQITNESRWENELRYLDQHFDTDPLVLSQLESSLTKPCESRVLNQHFASLQEAALYLVSCWVKDSGETDETSHLFYHFRVEVRRLVALCCAGSLQADLFILDEFQRFQSLTDQSSDSEESLIARQVFSDKGKIKKAKSKVLLLSATPFKAMTTINDEDDERSHHEQLHKLLDFLSHNNVDFVSQYEMKRNLLHGDMLTLSSGNTDFESISDTNARSVEKLLREYIARTERSQISKGFEQLIHSNELCCGSDFSVEEVQGYRAIEALNAVLPKGRGGVSLIEFAKSAPWAMSFLNGYVFKELYHRNINNPEVKKLVDKSQSTEQIHAWLSRNNVQNYKLNVEQSAPNAKIKALSKVIFEGSSENLLWSPPCKPYYQFDGVFKGNENFTKTLLFSSWALVPKALSCLWSYEAERRVLKGKGKRPQYHSGKNASPLLRFEGQSTLNVWHLLYPCKSLAEVLYLDGSLDEVLAQQTMLIQSKLACLKQYESDDKTNSDWYVLAPMLLDRQAGKTGHFDQWLEVIESRLRNEGRIKHFDKIKQYLEDAESLSLGKMPDDLAEVLAYSSLANPATCAMRTIQALWSEGISEFDLVSYSVQFAELTTRLFNHEYAIPIVKRNVKHTLLSGQTASPAWYKVLVYCAHGNYQSMLDEYCHLLATSGSDVHAATSKLEHAMGIRSSSEQVHFWENRTKAKDKCSSSMRCHFAVPLGNQKLNDDSGLKRVVSVRDAFNSPFRPFVLSSTSIGQEGLDFHWYCRRVVHWNLPNNPIDIEQREGRVNRYKSLVVRQRIAENHTPDFGNKADVWEQLFAQAATDDANKTSDLEPYWFTPNGKAQIERIVPTYPMSKEVAKYAEVKKILVLYRLAFGQPRQQELLESFTACDIESEEFNRVKDSLIIDLAPLNAI